VRSRTDTALSPRYRTSHRLCLPKGYDSSPSSLKYTQKHSNGDLPTAKPVQTPYKKAATSQPLRADPRRLSRLLQTVQHRKSPRTDRLTAIQNSSITRSFFARCRPSPASPPCGCDGQCVDPTTVQYTTQSAQTVFPSKSKISTKTRNNSVFGALPTHESPKTTTKHPVIGVVKFQRGGFSDE